jgi:phosphonopyruvate decarboxylase
MTFRRDDALRALIPYVTEDDIVVAVYQSCFDWLVLNPRDLNYVAVGAMGQASSHGLGLALANPDRRIIVLDGDGSLLMNLGSLITVANAGVTNFYHFLSANRVYEVNGAHPLPGAEIVDFAGLATAAGYVGSRSVSTLSSFSDGLADIFAQPGPQFTALEWVAGKAYPREYDYIHSAGARDSFRRALARQASTPSEKLPESPNSTT